MSLDDRLRAALHEEASAEAPRNRWNEVRERARRVRTHRTRTRAVAALAVAIAVVGAALAVVTRDDDRSAHVAAGPFPTREIAAIVGDRLVVLSADDGHTIRVLANGLTPTLTFGGISATPDGKTIYFTRLHHEAPCDRQEIVSVSSEGGPVKVVADNGNGPVVSPDGRTLAYTRPSAACSASTTLVLRKLLPADERTFAVAPEYEPTIAAPMAWSPDGHRVLVGWYGDPGSLDPELPGIDNLDTATGARAYSLPGPTESATFLSDGQLIASIRIDGGHRILTVNEDGSFGQTLLESTTAGVLHSMRTNASGQVLLHFGGSLLQTWNIGSEPKTIVDGLVRDATWLPPTHAAAPAVSKQNIAAVTGNRIVELSPNGTELRTIVDGVAEKSSIAVSPDGTSVFFTRVVDGCSGIYRVPIAGGTAERVVPGGDPVISPDGVWLAYVASDCQAGTGDPRAFLGLTNLRTGANYRPYEQWFGGHPSKLDVVAWSPGSDRLLFEVFRDFDGGDDQRAFVLDELPLAHGGDPKRFHARELIGAAAYLSNGHVLAAVPRGPGYEMAEIDGDNVVATRYRDVGASPREISLDASGRLLATMQDRHLVVQEGMGAPHQIADSIDSAIWLPAAADSA